MSQVGVYANKQLALQPAAPAHDVHIEGEKTEQKAIQRRTVDALGTYITLLRDRPDHWDEFRYRTMVPTAAAAATELLPPIGYLSQPASSFMSKYTHMNVTKIRCSIDSVAWTPDGKRCLTGSHRGEFTLWNGISFKFEGILQAHEGAITCMRYTHNENWLVTSDAVGRLKYWKGRNELVKDFQAHREAVRCVSFAPSDLKFATASADSTLKIWDFRTCQDDRTLAGHARDVLSCDWNPSSSAVASSSRDYTIRLWDARLGGEALSSLEGHMNEVTTVQWHRNGFHLLSAGRDSQLKIWDTRTLKELSNFTGSGGPINCASWHPIHEDVFVSGGHDGALHFWMAGQPGIQTSVIGAHEGPVWCLSWHPLGHLLATGGADHCARFWCRGRPGDAWRERARADREGAAAAAAGAPAQRQPGGFAVPVGAIPGIGDTIPGLPSGGGAQLAGAPPPPPAPPPHPPGPGAHTARPAQMRPLHSSGPFPPAPMGRTGRRGREDGYRGRGRGRGGRPRIMRPQQA